MTHRLTNVVLQSVVALTKSSYEISYDKKTSMTYEQFVEMAGANNTPISDAEKSYWASIEKNRPVYAIDNEFSLFADRTEQWNLNRLTRNDSIIHNKPRCKDKVFYSLF